MQDALVRAAHLRDELKSWLLRDAYPLWWDRGADRENGGFHESLSPGAEPVREPRRSRVQPRQMYAFSQADPLGWKGPFRSAVEHGLKFQLAKYRRPDGFFRTLVAADGSPLNDSVLLYDQAFALFGLAAAHATLPLSTAQEVAVDLRERLRAHFRHAVSGFECALPPALPLLSNPHMHLLEASLAWRDVSAAPEWQVISDEIAELALSRFIDGTRGIVREYFDTQWNVASGTAGRTLEPGHQYEWAWLLMRWAARSDRPEVISAALRLIETGEAHGVDHERGVAMNAILDDFSLVDASARLWPQTERIKAACLAAVITREARYWTIAVQSGQALLRYLDTPVAGLWRDRMQLDGSFVDEPAPASSFYHIVCAIAELDRAIGP
jgi:mannose/cellobiose epimerase-like protein (N-acyl-D-glucosamine 2-epimerase family)